MLWCAAAAHLEVIHSGAPDTQVLAAEGLQILQQQTCQAMSVTTSPRWHPCVTIKASSVSPCCTSTPVTLVTKECCQPS
jgi:hypothetical protein